jgi:predicted Zn-ribbon and HTH transcriptional regulator
MVWGEDVLGFSKEITWRVAVRAVRAIRSFEEIIRAAQRKEQYLLHQSAVCAKRGFMKHRQPSTQLLGAKQ